MPITIVTGPPGAGKTTVSSMLARSSPRGVHLQVDQCFHWIVSGYVEPWSPASRDQNGAVIEAVGAASARFTAGGYDVVVDGVVGPWFLDRFVAGTGPSAVGLRYVVLRPTRDIARQRAVARSGRHDLVDPGPIDSVYDAFQHLGPFESHVIDSTGEEATDTVPSLLRGVESGRFDVPLSRPPAV